MRKVLWTIVPLLVLPGCIAKTALSVATAPVRVASKAVDLATTSQSEADRNRGRDMRLNEERRGKLERSYERQSRKCADGDARACDRAESDYDAMMRSGS